MLPELLDYMDNKRGTVIINGLQVTYYKLGKGNPLLFLHGGRVRALTFQKLLQVLAKNYTVIAPDIPGYGDSEIPQEAWSFKEYGQFFDAFLSTLQITNVTVMGYSMGGGIAINLAAQSSRISQLILIDASGIKLPRMSNNYHDIRRLFFYFTHPKYFNSFYILVNDYSRFLVKHLRTMRQIKRIRQTCLETSYEEVFKQITLPTIILWGRDDWIYPLDIAYEFQKRIPGSKLKFVNGTHDWLVYDPSQCIHHPI